MSYQSKTTVVTISVGLWRETTNCSLSLRLAAAHAIAVQIASECQMDIMSITPYALSEDGEEGCRATIVYVNNGRSLEDIRRIMKPEIDNRQPKYWMILDLSEWQGLLDCVASCRDSNEEWD